MSCGDRASKGSKFSISFTVEEAETRQGRQGIKMGISQLPNLKE